jgi:TetR/AcrR family transcriptional repressor of nem operon
MTNDSAGYGEGGGGVKLGWRLDLTGRSTIVVGMGRSSDARERLMDATLALMWEESYGAVTIDDICRRAGVKKGSFYYFFDGKASLAVEALERAWTQEKAWWDETFSASVPPK